MTSPEPLRPTKRELEAQLGGIPPVGKLNGSAGRALTQAEIDADPIVQALRILGLELGPSSTGWGLDILCPWRHEHSGRGETGAAYQPGTGHFKCHHGHCENRTREEFRSRINELLRERGEATIAAFEFDEVDEPEPELTGSRNLASYEATEDGLALAFAAEHEGKLRFDGKRKKWFVWTGNYWRQDDTERAFVWARELLRRYRKGAQDLTAAQARVWGKIAAARAIEQAARAQMAVDGGCWDQDVWLAGYPGGELDLRTGTMMPADPVHGITKQLAVTPDPKMPVPLWHRFLWESTGGDIEMIVFLQAWYGYNLTGDVSEEKFVFEYGTGGNGKGTLIYTIGAILNDYACRCDVDMFMVRKYKPHSEEVARLMGVRMVTTTESEEGRTFDAVRLKDFTGRDGKLTGRFMRENSVDFAAQFKLTFVGNNQPRLPDVDEAMRRRLVLVPFTQTPAVPDITLKDRLVDEYPGILAWLIEGETLRRISGGLSKLVPDRARLATEVYLANQDTLLRWAGEKCLFSPVDQMSVTEAFEDYQDWCLDNSEPIQVSSKTFGDKFCTKFLKCHKKKNNKHFVVGVRLL